MKFGLVKHLNARPLTYGIEKIGNHELVYDNPSVLKDELLKGNLDVALISSIECLRNKDRLDFSYSTGVCAKDKVRSILFFKNKKEKLGETNIFVDHGSRSSVALLKVLLEEEIGFVPVTQSENPEIIQSWIQEGKHSHLLFGDNALVANWNQDYFDVIDLATWWNQKTQKQFCFALWAYPKGKKISEDIFYKSLEYGLTHIEEIISREHRFPHWLTSRYLKNELHYVLDEKDKEGLTLFETKCKNIGIL